MSNMLRLAGVKNTHLIWSASGSLWPQSFHVHRTRALDLLPTEEDPEGVGKPASTVRSCSTREHAICSTASLASDAPKRSGDNMSAPQGSGMGVSWRRVSSAGSIVASSPQPPASVSVDEVGFDMAKPELEDLISLSGRLVSSSNGGAGRGGGAGAGGGGGGGGGARGV